VIELRAVEGGVLLPVKARPAGKRNAIEGEHGGALRVTVTAAPEKGKANEAIAELLSTALGVRSSSITLVRGATTSTKTFRIEGLGVDDLSSRLRPHVNA
jgi:uncharacterized protein (TIGR00251 family)